MRMARLKTTGGVLYFPPDKIVMNDSGYFWLYTENPEKDDMWKLDMLLPEAVAELDAAMNWKPEKPHVHGLAPARNRTP